MELHDDCRIMEFPNSSLELKKWFIGLHNAIMDLYNPIDGDP